MRRARDQLSTLRADDTSWTTTQCLKLMLRCLGLVNDAATPLAAYLPIFRGLVRIEPAGI